MYGSWAGAFGNFQFMPSTIKNYAIDYNNNANIELKKSRTLLHLLQIILIKLVGKKINHVFIKLNLKENIPLKYLNTSAKKIKNKKN